MIRWYDWIAAVSVAYCITGAIFTDIPFIGILIAWFFYEIIWTSFYITMRVKLENNR